MGSMFNFFKIPKTKLFSDVTSVSRATFGSLVSDCSPFAIINTTCRNMFKHFLVRRNTSNVLFRSSSTFFKRISWNNLIFSFGSVGLVYAARDTFELKPQKYKIDLERLDPSTLKYSYLISQSVAMTVDAATNLLTQTTLAVLEADENYRREVTKLIKLLEDHLMKLSKHLEEDQDWDIIIATRSEADSKKRILNDLEMYIQSVVHLFNKASEVAYLADCDFVSIAATERLQTSLNSIQLSKEKTASLETEYIKLYSKIITETGKEKGLTTTPPTTTADEKTTPIPPSTVVADDLLHTAF